MSYIKLTKIWDDDDTMLQVELESSNDAHATTQDFYIYPEEILELGAKIAEYFPVGGKGEVLYEYGSETENFYSYVKLRIFYINSGTIGIHVRTNNKQEGADFALSEFYMHSELQSVNDFGKKLKHWATDNREPLVWQIGSA